jgi:hypothetical protein
LFGRIHLDVSGRVTLQGKLKAMDLQTHLTRDASERQLRRLQHWRCSIEADGYSTLLSAVPPRGLIVRAKVGTDRWLAFAPDCSLAVFERDAAGHVHCQQHVVDALGSGSEDDSASAASAAVRQFLREEPSPSIDRLGLVR